MLAYAFRRNAGSKPDSAPGRCVHAEHGDIGRPQPNARVTFEQMRELETAVAVVGAGPVGVALALELGLRGVECTVIEPDPRDRLVPRAKLANVRTMEHCRRWGIARAVRAASSLPASFSTEIAFVTSLGGFELTRFENVFFTAPTGDDRFSEPAQQIPQYQLEPVLRRSAVSFPTVRFLDGHRAIRITQDDKTVRTATLDASGRAGPEVAAEYLVGCDGARSTVRDLLGIGVGGIRTIARNFGVVFRAPALRDEIRFAPALHYWITNPERPSFMGPLDTVDLWWLQATAIPPELDLDDLDPAELVAASIGLDVDLEVITTDPWEAHALLADRLRDRRCFLAGDAAHVHAPMGAHGMNLGMGDAVDLGWKLAAVLDGWADSSLLDTYELERTPLHQRVIDEATTNYASPPNQFAAFGLETQGPAGDARRRDVAGTIRAAKQREFSSLGLVLGHAYEPSPIVASDGIAPAPESVVQFDPIARPGGRAPHAWLAPHRSLFDLFGLGFTLLRFDETLDPTPLASAAATRHIPFSIQTIPDPLVRPLYQHDLALVRPDQHVAWHGDVLPDDPGQLLDLVTGRATPT
jgi:2-polyprenyl-6-methoxyphenol hydroxylase-like FAD-dependent oxidoreductase